MGRTFESVCCYCSSFCYGSVLFWLYNDYEFMMLRFKNHTTQHVWLDGTQKHSRTVLRCPSISLRNARNPWDNMTSSSIKGTLVPGYVGTGGYTCISGAIESRPFLSQPDRGPTTPMKRCGNPRSSTIEVIGWLAGWLAEWFALIPHSVHTFFY